MDEVSRKRSVRAARALGGGGKALREAPRPTIRLVAKRAGVAVSTVSRVLNGGYASEAVKARVQQTVRELGYTPSLAAQSLAAGQAGCIGVVAHSSGTSWFSQILSGIEGALVESRRSVLLSSLVVGERYSGSAVSGWISGRRVDGLIFIRLDSREAELFRRAKAAGLPVVLIVPDQAEAADATIRCDNLRAGRLVGAHLAEWGHRRIAFFGGPRESVDAQERLAGLRTAVRERGLRLPDDQVAFAEDYSSRAGALRAQAFLALAAQRRPTAVVLGNDAMALGFLRVVLRAGLSVPGDVSVVGFDGIPEAEWYWPGLTTVLQPSHRMGRAGAEALLQQLGRGGEPAIGLNTRTFDVGLVVRESTGPPRPAL